MYQLFFYGRNWGDRYAMLGEDVAEEEFKKCLARFPPPIIHNNICIQHSLCKDAYAVQWWMRVDRALLDPLVPISALSVPSLMWEVARSDVYWDGRLLPKEGYGCRKRDLDLQYSSGYHGRGVGQAVDHGRVWIGVAHPTLLPLPITLCNYYQSIAHSFTRHFHLIFPFSLRWSFSLYTYYLLVSRPVPITYPHPILFPHRKSNDNEDCSSLCLWSITDLRQPESNGQRMARPLGTPLMRPPSWSKITRAYNYQIITCFTTPTSYT